MEIIRGKHASFIDASAFAAHAAGYANMHIDIGTGDGRFVRHLAQSRHDTFVVGLDSCRENLHEVSRRPPSNAVFVIANALALPPELAGVATSISINFPWGSLIEGLLDGEPTLIDGLLMLSRPSTQLEVRLNGGALAEAGWQLTAGANRVYEVLSAKGFAMHSPVSLVADDLRAFPTTWAKRLAYGRDPRAMYLRGTNNLTHAEPVGDLMQVW